MSAPTRSLALTRSLARAALLAGLLVSAGASASGQDFSGSWRISGADPQLGAYAGHALVTRSGSGYTVARLVELAQPLPDGRVLALSWGGQARNEGGGLRVEADLRQQEFLRRVGNAARGPQHAAPLRLSARLAPAAGGDLSGDFARPGVAGGETWTRAAQPAPPIPLLERRLEAAPVTVPRALFWRLFGAYHQLPELAPYVNRPEFQAAVHYQMIDDTGRAWSRAHPDRLLVVQKVPDEIGRFEEDMRCRAFRSPLSEKARGWDAAMLTDHVEASTGMLGGRIPGGGRFVQVDSALHQGVWVASQAFRWQVTGEPVALQNVELGVRALDLCVDAPGDPTQFARAVGEAGAADPAWTRSTALPGIAYLPGGNNDMMHGISYGYAMAERVLPAGHPLLAGIGRRADQLVRHQKSAQRGKHRLVLAGVAARHSGDPGARGRYRRALWSPLELLWTFLGEGMTFQQEVSGRSGPHLGTTTFVKLMHLGDGSPDLLERLWIAAARRGARYAFEKTRVNRPGNLALVAALAGAGAGAGVGPADVGREVLGEIPYPQVLGPGEVDWKLDAGFCASPWPFLPWKFDFIQNVQGRFQSLVAYPLWSHGDTDNWWKEGPYYSPLRGGVSGVLWSRQDYLHAYWVGRKAGAIGPGD